MTFLWTSLCEMSSASENAMPEDELEEGEDEQSDAAGVGKAFQQVPALGSQGAWDSDTLDTGHLRKLDR